MTIRSKAVVVFILCISNLALADTPQTMRLDYFHSGNRDTEMFRDDRERCLLLRARKEKTEYHDYDHPPEQRRNDSCVQWQQQ